MSIQDYYYKFVSLWSDYTEIIYMDLSTASSTLVQDIHKTSQRNQLLMKLRLEFEPVRSNLMSRVPSPSIETCLGELLREEQWITTQAAFAQKTLGGPIYVAYTAKGKPQSRDMSNVQCYSYQKYGHVATQCNQKFYMYCKNKGHVLPECRKWPQYQSQKVNLVIMNESPPALTPIANTSPAASPATSSTSSTSLTPKMAQRMIVNASWTFR